jgi:hypothetical protein
MHALGVIPVDLIIQTRVPRARLVHDNSLPNGISTATAKNRDANAAWIFGSALPSAAEQAKSPGSAATAQAWGRAKSPSSLAQLMNI